MDEFGSKSSLRSTHEQKTKRPRWKRIFFNKEADEEEYVLLPMFSKEKNQIKVVKNGLENPDNKDWWMKYFSSQTVLIFQIAFIEIGKQ